MYGSSCSYTKLYQAWSLPYIAVHAVIPRPIRLEAFRVRQFMQVIPRPIRLKSFHVWQFTQSSRDLSGVKLSINGSSCSYSKTYQAWRFSCLAVHAIIFVLPHSLYFFLSIPLYSPRQGWTTVLQIAEGPRLHTAQQFWSNRTLNVNFRGPTMILLQERKMSTDPSNKLYEMWGRNSTKEYLLG